MRTSAVLCSAQCVCDQAKQCACHAGMLHRGGALPVCQSVVDLLAVPVAAQLELAPAFCASWPIFWGCTDSNGAILRLLGDFAQGLAASVRSAAVDLQRMRLAAQPGFGSHATRCAHWQGAFLVVSYVMRQPVLCDSAQDEAASVRQAAVDLLGAHLAAQPELAATYFDTLVAASRDGATSVRRAAVRTLWDACIRPPGAARGAEACCAVLHRGGDPEESIGDLVAHIFHDLWFASAAKGALALRATCTAMKWVSWVWVPAAQPLHKVRSPCCLVASLGNTGVGLDGFEHIQVKGRLEVLGRNLHWGRWSRLQGCLVPSQACTCTTNKL